VVVGQEDHGFDIASRWQYDYLPARLTAA